MKKAWILAGLGVLSLLAFACSGSARPGASAPAPLESAPAPFTLIADDAADDVANSADRIRVVSESERQAVIRKAGLPQVEPSDQILEYTLYSRSGPMKHYRVRKPAPATDRID